MNSRTTLTALLIAMVLTAGAQASFTVLERDEIPKLLKGTLCVVPKVKDEDEVKRLSKKPDELKQYEESIEAANAIIKAAVEKEWSLSKVKFITRAEADELKKNKVEGQYLLVLGSIDNYKVGDFYRGTGTGFGSIYSGESTQAAGRAYHLMPAGSSAVLAIIPAASPKKEIVMSYLPAMGLCPATATYMVMHLKNQIEDAQQGVNGVSDIRKAIAKKVDALATKTLIVFDPLISIRLKKVMDEGEIKKYYPYPIELVSFEKADEIIASKDSQYAYIWPVSAGAVAGARTLYNYFIIDAADGRPMFLTGKAIAEPGTFHQKHLEMAANRSED